VCRVVILIGIKVEVGIFSVQATRFTNRAVRAFERAGQHKLDAVGAQYLLALLTGVLRQSELDAVAARRANPAISDAGVAARRIKDDLVARETACALAFQDHAKRGPVLDRAARVEPLGLRANLNATRRR